MSLSTLFKVVSLAIIAVAGSAHAAPLLTNGSFEANAQGNGSWAIYSGLTGWSAAPVVELRNNISGAAQDGVNYVELDVVRNSSIFQNVNTVAGQTYTVSFWYSPRTRVSAASNPIALLWGGNSVASVTGNGTGSGNVWQQYSYKLVAASALTELRFSAGGTSDGYGGSLDNVTLNAVPEPATFAMFGLALGLLAFSSRRKQK